MNEITGVFSPSRHLTGTLGLPDVPPPRSVGFVMLNSGVIHRIGPHRFNVKLAQALAARGFASIRFDLSGQGDSRQPPTTIPFLDQAASDVRAAMDHLQRTTGVARFAIIGLCSGAHHASTVARMDERVVGLWMYDSFIYQTPKTRAAYYKHRLATEGVSAVGGWLRNRMREVARPSNDPPAVENPIEYWQACPPKDEYGRMLQELVRRDVNIFMVHSGAFIDEYSYAEQFHDAFAEYIQPSEIRCDFRPEFDHTVTALAAQQSLIAEIAEWGDRLAVAQPRGWGP